MTVTVMTLDEWTRATGSPSRVERERVNGPSPGGLAGKLGMSRQAIHSAIGRGTLDAVRIIDRQGNLRAIVIPEASARQFEALRELRSDAG